MKKPLCFIASVMIMQLISLSSFSQATRTSVANGSWLMPTTWDCNCVPMPWDNIVVNHTVSLDTSWTSATTITVNTSGTITEGSSLRQWAITGGNFTNHGYVNISRVSLTGGAFTNNDSLRINQAFYITAGFINNGTIFDVDSFSNDGIFRNTASGTINCTLYSNLDSIINDGVINAFAHTNLAKSYNTGVLNFTDFTNSGTLVNNGTIMCNDFTNWVGGSATNLSVFSGTHDFLNVGKFTNTANGTITVANDFANADSTASFASFINNGFVQVGSHWLNIDSVSGNGGFCVADSTANTGIMAGTFDFCDNTPPTSSPYIDWNSGIIGTGITYCSKSCNIGFAESVKEERELVVFPNPCSDVIFIRCYLQKSSGNNYTYPAVKIFDLLGQEVFSSEIFGPDSGIHFDLPNGIYFFRVPSGNTILSKKITVSQ